MNNLDFQFEIGVPAIKLLELLKDLHDELNYFKDDDLLLQSTPKILIDDPFNLLNLSEFSLEREYSNYSLHPVLIQEEEKTKQRQKKTKKNNYINEHDQNPYQCGYCKRSFKYSYSLGGHIQKSHKSKKDQQSLTSSLQLRKRQKI